tara:strand:+ start:123 stop:737 length:615 start_codon:yes stop_codon:yes gene_type:complete
MNIYYVYQYLREDQTPYYIGKGSTNRINEGHALPIPIKERRVMIAENLSEQAAFDLEIELIAKYGRKDLGTGILRNLTDGGDGASGYRYTEERKQDYSKRMKKTNAKRKQEGWEYPESARKTISEMQKGVPKPKEWVDNVAAALNNRTEEEKADWKAKIAATKIGKPRSEETKAKLRAANKGKKLSEETKAKIRATKLAKRKSL